MTKIKVAIVGCGNVADGHLAAWRRTPHSEVVAVCDTNAKAVERVAMKWKVSKTFSSVSEMSEDDGITLWDICTPIQTHKQLARQAMENGLDVLIEKPMTVTSQDAKEIVECQESTKRKAGVVHNWLFEPPVIRARTIVNRGRIGEIIGARMAILHTRYESMIADKDHWSHRLPGGRFSEMMIHPIYILRCFLGEIQVSNVVASKIGEYQWMKHDELSATFRAGEKLGNVYVSFNAPRDAIYLDIFGRDGIIRLDIIAATLRVLPSAKMERFNKVVDSLRQSIQLSSSTFGNIFKVAFKQWLVGHEMCIRLFAESIVTGGEPPVTVREGYEVVKVLEDIYNRTD